MGQPNTPHPRGVTPTNSLQPGCFLYGDSSSGEGSRHPPPKCWFSAGREGGDRLKLWLAHQPAPPADAVAVFAAESLVASRQLSTLWQRSGEPSWETFLRRWATVLPEAAWFQLAPAQPIAGGPEAVAACYARAVPRRHRLRQGQFFTPVWLAQKMVENLELTPADRCAEPSAGCGVFVVELVRHFLALGAAPAELERHIWAAELSPLLALCTRVQFYLALPELARIRAPVVCADVLAQPLPAGITAIIGNPPWVPMSSLGPDAHQRAVALFRQLGMAPPGRSARLGEANADLCGLFAVHLVRQLPQHGRAALLLKRDILVNAAGAALRRRLAEGDLRLKRIDDISALRLFDSQSGCVLTHWTRGGDGGQVVPLYEWDTAGTIRPGRVLELAPPATVGFPYPVRHGVKHDRAAVFELDVVRAGPRGVELASGDWLEREHVYPLLKSRHLRPWGIEGYTYALVPQRKAGDNSLSPASFPLTYAYLSRHEAALRERRSCWLRQGPFYSIFGVGPYTWAPYKVAWCRMGRPRGFAVVSEVDDPLLGRRPLLPDHTFLAVPCQSEAEAHFLCACLNSAGVSTWLRENVPAGKSGLTAGIIRGLKLSSFDPADSRHQALAAASRAAHAAYPAVPASLLGQVAEMAAQVLTLPG